MRASNDLSQTGNDFKGILRGLFLRQGCIFSRFNFTQDNLMEASCDIPTRAHTRTKTWKYANADTNLIVAHQMLSRELQHL